MELNLLKQFYSVAHKSNDNLIRTREYKVQI